MLAIPAIDLREGHVVQLVGGEYDREQVRLDDPRRVARQWATAGFARLHVVDLDAATGRGSNRESVIQLLWDQAAALQVGGGVRTEEDIVSLLEAGAASVILGTRALEDLDWLASMAELHPGRCILAADVRERKVTTRGWARTLERDVVQVVEEVSSLATGRIARHRGAPRGKDAGHRPSADGGCRGRVPVSRHRLGGIGSLADLRALDDRGVSAAVIGMALYTGAIDPRVLAEEFSQ